MIWFDLIWRPFSHDLIWFEFAKSLSIHFLIQNVDSCETNDTDEKSSLRAFDRCHICLLNHNFDLFMAWFWLHPKFWFEIGIKSWFDLNWFDLIWRKFSPQIMIWFDLTPYKKVRDLIWFEVKSFLCRFDLIWICPPLLGTWSNYYIRWRLLQHTSNCRALSSQNKCSPGQTPNPKWRRRSTTNVS